MLLRLLGSIIFSFLTVEAQADQVIPAPRSEAAPELKPLFEFGAYFGGGIGPDYPASDQSHFHALAIPTGIYRGEVVQAAEKEGLTARLLRGRRVRLNLSAAGSFPASGTDNSARRGMPDLDWIGEIGPNLSFLLAEETEDERWAFNIPVRHVLSTNFQTFRAHGWVIGPNFKWYRANAFIPRLTLTTELECSWASEGVTSLFYHVAPTYATASRPAYEAGAGFMESSFILGLSYRPGPWHFFLRSWVSRYDGSQNRSSPLFKSYGAVGGFVGFGYWFYESTAKGFNSL